MKGQRINPNNLNPMQMNNMSSMMGMMNTMQRIGKSKRKYTIKLEKANKKFLAKFIDEIKKQFAGQETAPQQQGVIDFLDYLKTQCEIKDRTEVKVSFEELEFLKRMIGDSIRGMEGMQFKWYQLIKKAMMKVMLNQYKQLFEEIKK
ncbi:hypothetical protein PM10SUCC1_20490 [Propionigenium maris DSM 9537]|uniref:Uncharacterized protein n=1 Tax=Propionigenium maris DSM 9537 TaxID=1123000 RepID=A0A9W6GM95_9FUSO|nr:hypothetical protein [Propionigenium maris]GLI56535.1 hypothetical protein PM10SUCC1_20490 [Propionigenium maris DSM 9537]